MASNASRNDTPRVGERGTSGGDRDAFQPEESQVSSRSTGGGDPERTFLEAMRRMNSVGEAAERDYQRALSRVRDHSDETIAAVARAGWESLPESAYLDRWALVQLLADLAMPAAADVLDAVLSTPLPPERSAERDHRYSTVGQEIVVRTTAVEGLRRLAANDDARAGETLVRHIRHENRTVRVACVMALRDLGRGYEESLRSAISEEDRFLLDIRRLPPSDVPQPTTVDQVRLPGKGRPVPPPAS
jgi:hypothetical protein